MAKSELLSSFAASLVRVGSVVMPSADTIAAWHAPIMAGEYVYLGGPAIPAGKRIVKLNGASLVRNDFPHLWAYAQASGLLAATQGAKTAAQFGPGDGSTTFTLPDARGYFLRAFDDGRGIDASRLIHEIQQHAMQAHNHQMPIGFQILNSAFYVYYNLSGLQGEFGNSPVASVYRQVSSTGQDTPQTSSIRSNTSQMTNLSGENRPVNLAAVLGIRY